MSDPTLRSSRSFGSSLEEQTGLSARDLSATGCCRARPAPGRPPPRGGPGDTHPRRREPRADRRRDAARGRRARLRGGGARGGARGGSGKGKPVVLVTSDLDAARRAADDVAFFVKSTTDEATAEDTAEGDVLVLAASESSPYADVNPDRRAAMSRLATLFHLASGLPWKVLAVPAAGLARKMVPRKIIRAHSHRVVAEDELDRDALVKALAESGYLRVPVVEDPGSFAVRGALLDVWPPNLDVPVRIEMYGELVLSIQPFDPYEQRTKKVNGEDSEATRGLAPSGARGRPHARNDRARARPRAAARRHDRSADDASACAHRGRDCGACVLRRGGDAPCLLRGARVALSLPPRRRDRRPRRPAGSHQGAARGARRAPRRTWRRRGGEPVVPPWRRSTPTRARSPPSSRSGPSSRCIARRSSGASRRGSRRGRSRGTQSTSRRATTPTSSAR